MPNKTHASVTGYIDGLAWGGFEAELPMAGTIARHCRAPLRALVKRNCGDFERARAFSGVVTFRRVTGRGRIALREREVSFDL